MKMAVVPSLERTHCACTHARGPNTANADGLCPGDEAGIPCGTRDKTHRRRALHGLSMMRATPQMRDFAARVIAFEMGENASSGTTTPVAFAVCEKLRPQWANLMGNIGFRTLLSRALTIASADAPWLKRVQVKADGPLEWTCELEVQADAAEMAAGSVVLITELLGLLEGFIGETLARRLMQDMWPKLPLNDSDSDKGK